MFVESNTVDPSGMPEDRGRSEKKDNARIRSIKSTETGMGLALYREVKYKFKDDPLRQAGEFIERFSIPAGTGRKRKASLLTRKAYLDRLMTLVRTLAEMNMRVHNLDEITPKQVRLFFQKLEADGASSSWLGNLNTTIRRFGIWIGKPELCPVIRKLVVNPESAVRHYTALDPQDWASKGVDVEEVIERVGCNCKVTAMHLRMGHAFGMRASEMVMVKPALLERQPGFISVEDGTKGGRKRMVKIETAYQRAVLTEAIAMAASNSKGRLIAVKGKNLKQAIRYFYYQLEKAGITKKESGVVAHGLRKGYACEVYQRAAGIPAPVMGMGGLVDKTTHVKAELEVAEALGHGRRTASRPYIGNRRTLTRVQAKRLERVTEKLEKDPTLLEMAREAGLRAFYIVGPAADGKPLGQGPMMIAASAAQRAGETQQLADMRVMQIVLDMIDRCGQLMGVHTSYYRIDKVTPDMPTFALHGLAVGQDDATGTLMAPNTLGEGGSL